MTPDLVDREGVASQPHVRQEDGATPDLSQYRRAADADSYEHHRRWQRANDRGELERDAKYWPLSWDGG
jgi:hypothetical protein